MYFLPGSQKTFVESCGRRNRSPNNHYKCSLYLTGKVSNTNILWSVSSSPQTGYGYLRPGKTPLTFHALQWL